MSSDKISDVLDELLSAPEKIKEIERNINKKYSKEMYKEFSYICGHRVDDFYDSLDPNSYDRFGDLYNAYKITKDENTGIVTCEFGPEFMQHDHTHKNSKLTPDELNKYIYDIDFVEGWHGGGLNYESGISTPYYRTPPRWDTWYRRADKTDGVLPLIKKDIEKQNKEITEKYQKELDEDLDKVISKIERKINQILK